MQKRQVTIEEFRDINEKSYISNGSKDNCKHRKLVEFEIVDESGNHRTMCYACPMCGAVPVEVGNYKVINIDWINISDKLRNEYFSNKIIID